MRILTNDSSDENIEKFAQELGIELWALRNMLRYYGLTIRARDFIRFHYEYWERLRLEQLPLEIQNILSEWSAHVSKNNSDMVAFQPDCAKREQDIFQVSKPAKVLRKAYKEFGIPTPNDHIIRDMAEILLPLKTKNLNLTFIDSDIGYFYANAPIDSCMAKDTECFENSWPYHPCDAYGKGWRLAVLYEGENLNDAYSNVVARAMVIDHQGYKCYNRIYLNTSMGLDEDVAYKKMRFKLDEFDYTYMISKEFADCIVESKVEFNDLISNNNLVVFPYVDSKELYVVRSAGKLLLSFDEEGSIGTSHASYDEKGTCEVGEECGNCGSRYPEDEGTYDDAICCMVCPSCAEDLVEALDSNGDLVRTSSDEVITDEGGTNWVDYDAALENDRVWTEDGYLVCIDDVIVTKDTSMFYFEEDNLFKYDGEYYEFSDNIPYDEDENEQKVA